ncbi:hypothetical protein FA13DRAFT_1776588 [Coprinellus micaceus]|uniref:Uncharacterized protein n=1 Tax=Coprinellus micaceus TaxID=71717 RepID=A0A4Y7SZ44_COPMI|nr:hypothetical protein FA13DRAFT_1776588 [Coprinellus micaceus]
MGVKLDPVPNLDSSPSSGLPRNELGRLAYLTAGSGFKRRFIDGRSTLDRKGLVVSEGIRKNDYRLSRPFVVRKGLMDRRGLVDPAERYWGRTLGGFEVFMGFVVITGKVRETRDHGSGDEEESRGKGLRQGKRSSNGDEEESSDKGVAVDFMSYNGAWGKQAGDCVLDYWSLLVLLVHSNFLGSVRRDDVMGVQMGAQRGSKEMDQNHLPVTYGVPL